MAVHTPIISAVAGFSHTLFVENAGPAENDPSLQFDVAATLVKLRIVVRGTTPSVTWELRKGTDRSAAGTLMASGTTTNTTTGDEVTTFADDSISAGEHVWLATTAQSGTVQSFRLTMFGA
jgi:hypothetical protein